MPAAGLWLGLALLLSGGGVVDESSFPLGDLDRQAIEAAEPTWGSAAARVEVDGEAIAALATVEHGAEVVVFLGTWCPDSAREIPRLWRILDQLPDPLPFTVRYVGVDLGLEDPAGEAPAADISFVPTFVVRREGREVGRVVETPEQSVERDLQELLSLRPRGGAHGDLQSRPSIRLCSPPCDPFPRWRSRS